jgi:hypothetical protein
MRAITVYSCPVIALKFTKCAQIIIIRGPTRPGAQEKLWAIRRDKKEGLKRNWNEAFRAVISLALSAVPPS